MGMPVGTEASGEEPTTVDSSTTAVTCSGFRVAVKEPAGIEESVDCETADGAAAATGVVSG